MKLEILVFVLGIVGLEGYCSSWLSNGLRCEGFAIEKGERLTMNSLRNELSLEKAKGTMDSETFKNLHILKKLRLQSCEIESMEDGTLCSIEMLQKLILEYNRKFPKLTHKSMGECDNLKEFRYTKPLHSNNKFLDNFDIDVFKSMKNIQSIDLNNFEFKKFDKALLEGLNHMENFTVLSSKMEEIDDDAFCMPPKLKLLNLQIYTDIFSRRLFNSCNNVKILYISSDHKNVFKEDTLQSMTKLTTIHLEVNLVTVTKNLFANLTNLQSITLGKCHIYYIEEDAFADQVHLKELTIHENSINKLSPYYLKPLKNLEYLNLVYNDLTRVDNIKYLPNLKILDVSNNEIKDFNASMVKQNLPKLEKFIIYNFVSNTELTCKRAVEIRKEFGSEIELVTNHYLKEPCNKTENI